jgi:hypothetical protein
LTELAGVELAGVHAERVGEFQNLAVRDDAAARVDEIVVLGRVPDGLVDILGGAEIVEPDVAGLIDQMRIPAR